MHYQSSLRVSTDLNNLVDVLNWFEQLRQLEIPPKVWMQCQTALAEGFTNVVRHAHKGKSSETPVDMEVVVLANAIEIRIWDYGPPFDFGQKLDNLSDEIDIESSSGRGLKILKSVADHLSYDPMPDSRNCLLLVKYYA